MGRSNKETMIDGVRAFSRVHAESQIELILVHVHPDSVSPTPWRTLEFWTSNTMYGLDSQLKCIEVSSRDPHANKVPNHLLGAVLVGSQVRGDTEISIAFPYPVPGMEAVLRLPDSGKHMNTSRVERVMLRVRMTSVALEDGQEPDWQAITTMWRPNG
jgi:hypothetical protein